MQTGGARRGIEGEQPLELDSMIPVIAEEAFGTVEVV
jgi:hypothetical protein